MKGTWYHWGKKELGFSSKCSPSFFCHVHTALFWWKWDLQHSRNAEKSSPLSASLPLCLQGSSKWLIDNISIFFFSVTWNSSAQTYSSRQTEEFHKAKIFLPFAVSQKREPTISNEAPWSFSNQSQAEDWKSGTTCSACSNNVCVGRWGGGWRQSKATKTLQLKLCQFTVSAPNLFIARQGR